MKFFERWKKFQQLLNARPVELRVVKNQRPEVGHSAGRWSQNRSLQAVQAQVNEFDARHLRENTENLLDGMRENEIFVLFSHFKLGHCHLAKRAA